MKLHFVRRCLVLSAFAVATSCQPAAPVAPAASNTEPVKEPPPVNWDVLAERLVNQSAGVRAGEVVQVLGGVQDLELIEDLAVHIRKAGAFPLVMINTDRMERRSYIDVPDKYDSQPQQAGLKLANLVNARIVVTSRTTENLFEGIDPRRVAIRGKADTAVAEEYLKRKVRTVTLDNALYPTPWRAKQLGMTEADLRKTFWQGANVDYTTLQARGDQVRKVLATGSELRITNPNGTDLKVLIKGRPVSVSDGIISAQDIERGGADSQVWLPAGEVYSVPVPGTAEGTVVHTRDFFEGKEIQNLTLTFARGEVASINGSGPGFDTFKKRYEAETDAKRRFAYVDFGINSNVALPPAAKMGTWLSAGMITVGIGGNVWAGGDNNISFGYPVFLPGSTVTLDGKTIIANGQLQIGAPNGSD